MTDIYQSDILKWAADYDGEPFHALLCDPPYEYGFMGKSWDASGISYQVDMWAGLAAHLHPGAFGMCFGGARTWHRLAVAIEDAGLIIHPSIFGWAYGSGFPKATRIDTQVDAAAGAEREAIEHISRGSRDDGADSLVYQEFKGIEATLPATDLAKTWVGHRYGLQAIKPALEPIIVFQKPYEGKPVDDITATGAGALNIDQSRVGGVSGDGHPQGRWPANFVLTHHDQCVRVGVRDVKSSQGVRGASTRIYGGGKAFTAATGEEVGYANADGKETIPDWRCHPECPVRKLGEQSGVSISSDASRHNTAKAHNRTQSMGKSTADWISRGHSDKGTAARFFYQADWMYERLEQADPVYYQAKASRRERDAGLDADFQKKMLRWSSGEQSPGTFQSDNTNKFARNFHPTIKPVSLSKWLATLLLPPQEYAPRRLLVPFSGVASEMIGAMLTGWEAITGIELDGEYCEIGRARLDWWTEKAAHMMWPDVKAILKGD